MTPTPTFHDRVTQLLEQFELADTPQTRAAMEYAISQAERADRYALCLPLEHSIACLSIEPETQTHQ